MELLLLFVFLLISCLALTFFRRKSKTNFNSQLPPGTTGWPIIGETFQLFSMGQKGTPEKFFMDRMKKYSKEVFKTSLLSEPISVFCGAAANKFLFSNENKLVSISWPRNLSKIFPNPEPTTTIADSSKKLRHMLLGFLKPDVLQNLVGVVDSVGKEHFQTHWDFQREVNVLSLAKMFAFTEACRVFLSIDDPNQIQDFAKPFDVMAAGIFSLPINLPGTPFYRAIKAARIIRKKLLVIIRQRKLDLVDKKPCHVGDLLSYMLTVPDDGGKFMSELEIADKMLGTIVGSQDTTTTAITFVMKYLAEFPDIYDEVLKEQRSIAEKKIPGDQLNWKDLQNMKYAWNVACEVLRLAPPLQGNFREAITDFKFSTFFIPKGSKIYWTPNTTHKNPEYFPKPEKFDPSRFEGTGPIPYAYVPFGGGARICPGKDFARLVMLVFIYNVVGKFRWEKVIPDEETVVVAVPLPTKGLPIRLYPH